LANLGIKTAYYGKIGDDASGKIVLTDLEKFGVSSKFCFKDKNFPTAVSFVISCGNDRTILVYKGACHFLAKSEIKFNEAQKAKWFYLAPFYEKTAELFSVLVNFTKEKNIKIAVNPSLYQIEKNDQEFINNLSKIDILFLNKEEAAILAKIPEGPIEELGKAIRKICPGIIVITQGDKGAAVFEGESLYKAYVYKVAVEDKTGAGDSFASGFMAGLLMENNIEYAIRLGMINSAKNISQKGAKSGLLSKAELKLLPNIDIVKERIY
jgi:sugar/nucleoside kinase (ribokinase family)